MKAKITVVQDDDRRCAVCFKHSPRFVRLDVSYEKIYLCIDCSRKVYLALSS